MTTNRLTIYVLAVVLLLFTFCMKVKGQDVAPVDSMDMPIAAVVDTTDTHATIELSKKELNRLRRDSIKLARKANKTDWATWKPDPKRAMWLAIVIPGGGQIYNHKYWKLPIFYGGFVGCAYAMRWNDQMYSDYSKAYLDLMDDDETTQSYNQFLHLGSKITEDNKSRWQSVFKSRKDRYRRWRDMSFFCILGVYALSVIDAYVDASLSQFDISDDLSLHLEPGFVGTSSSRQPLNTGIGLNCSLSF